MLIYDGQTFNQVGEPRRDQCVGTELERLIETAGRICYDSFGTGRSSVDYHEHIRAVNHGSVMEHAVFTLGFDIDCEFDWWKGVANRPGVWACGSPNRITLNVRSAYEWDNWGGNQEGILSQSVAYWLRQLAPAYNRRSDELDSEAWLATPDCDEEKWVSLLLSGSRGWSHEMVRHGDYTAISQRSTRFCDESESKWIMHPLLKQYLTEVDDTRLGAICLETESKAKIAYDMIVERLEPWLLGRGLDKTTARKQARGAGRGFLGNALWTEMVFSASVKQWRRILDQRLGAAADAEIREVMQIALADLRSSQYGDRFDSY